MHFFETSLSRNGQARKTQTATGCFRPRFSSGSDSKLKTDPKGSVHSLAPEAGLEPATSKLTASCSTIELLRNNYEGNLGFLHRNVSKADPKGQAFLLPSFSYSNIRYVTCALKEKSSRSVGFIPRTARWEKPWFVSLCEAISGVNYTFLVA